MNLDPLVIRCALLDALPDNDQSGAQPSRAPVFTYVPPSHVKAVRPDAVIVEGIRGSGKSFWWAALCSPEHRAFVMRAFPEAGLSDTTRTSQGFGAGLGLPLAPSKDVLAALVPTFNPRMIWRTVVGTHLELADLVGMRDWEARVAWVSSNTEAFDRLLADRDADLTASGTTHVVMFDALDRLADDWPAIRPLARALFQLALDLRALRSVRLKLFVRPDMREDREVFLFPDASKLLATKVDLTWRRADLYALLYQCIGSTPAHGGYFARTACGPRRSLFDDDGRAGDAWVVPAHLRTDEGEQRRVFHAIAGPTMASGPSGHKRGFPYTWLPNHLLDGRDEVSPRSFMAALRYACAILPPSDWPYALDFRGIEAGVREASRIRVEEITREDYPWVNDLMLPLKGRLTVPCHESEIAQIWSENQTLAHLRDRSFGPTLVKLPPRRLDDGPPGVLADLADLGVVLRLLDGRIQVPDVYRIAFGLGRKGGVRPLR